MVKPNQLLSWITPANSYFSLSVPSNEKPHFSITLTEARLAVTQSPNNFLMFKYFFV